jgi:hypothetical protein
LIAKELEAMEFQIVEPVRSQYVPDDKGLQESIELGRAIGRSINEQVAV